MRYELVNGVHTNTDVWQQEKKILLADNLHLLSIGSAPNFAGTMRQEAIKHSVNLYDWLTKRTAYDPDDYLFFNRAPVPDGTNILMNSDGFLALEYDGAPIGQMKLYPGTNRAVKEIDYFNPDGTNDLIEEYATDGRQYTQLFYNEGQPQEFDFLNLKGQPIIRYYYYENVLNYITIEDPETQEVLEHYDNLNEFVCRQVANLLTVQDQVTVCYMGVEMMALRYTKSHNILRLCENPFDEQGEIRGNLLGILNNDIQYIQEVQMTQAAYNALALRNFKLDKATVVADS
ncbi:hypothetical protein [Levilactobacillus spicheri]|uniref:Uncharacterized protein n=2 Tax=Levilactobacillus spicheri TaxID=216463 RepID=A0ABQ0WRH0_9LACO|nr:hypothetical protein [Levilactobacillus spicheri]KRL47497.1 hypothetical protein FD37_GL002365 [Levilactobacillus spicheri DSM 15429]GEO67712.1 hypothetical protein LSP04_21310 [Levilactobacillus spicheri]